MLYLHPLIFQPLVEISAQYHIDPCLVAAVIAAESNFDPMAIGDQGHSVGLMQLHDGGPGRYMSKEARQDPRTNILAGVDYLSNLYWQLHDWRSAISAYNQGLAGFLTYGLEANRPYWENVETAWRHYQTIGIAEGSFKLWMEGE